MFLTCDLSILHDDPSFKILLRSVSIWSITMNTELRFLALASAGMIKSISLGKKLILEGIIVVKAFII